MDIICASSSYRMDIYNKSNRLECLFVRLIIAMGLNSLIFDEFFLTQIFLYELLPPHECVCEDLFCATSLFFHSSYLSKYCVPHALILDSQT